MGIPRFYRWLKNRYPQIRMDLKDTTKQLPLIDNLYLDFNGLIYRCIREFECFLKNKFDPLSIDEILNATFEYMMSIIEQVNPQKIIYIAVDGVAPRAKINQSRDRRFKAISEKKQFTEFLSKIDLQDKELFQQNSISPGTDFLVTLCEQLEKKVMCYMQDQWKHLKVFFSDCLTPGEGQHKIMEFLRNTKKSKVFNDDATHCIYSADADVLLLSLATQVENIVLIREDSSKNQFGFSAQCFKRKYSDPAFEYVFINILREYMEKEFQECMKTLKLKTVQPIINDFILLMAFVGNDFLPLQFCFSLKQTHMQALFKSYKSYLLEAKVFINNGGNIDWKNTVKLLQICKDFQAKMLQQSLRNKKSNIAGRRPRNHQADTEEKDKAPQKKPKVSESSSESDKDQQQVANFEVVNNKITKGREYYYQKRFQISKIQNNPMYDDLIFKYLEGLEFYCQYYFQGVPSWSWYYPYHYTPLLVDIYDYISNHKIQIIFEPSKPFDPFMGLMMMLPKGSFHLLPQQIKQTLLKQENRDFLEEFFPEKFSLDPYDPVKYNRHTLIKFLDERQIRTIYSGIQRNQYSNRQKDRNSKKGTKLFVYENGIIKGLQVVFDGKDRQQQLLKTLRDLRLSKKTERSRFPTLAIFGNFELNESGKIISARKYQNASPNQLVYFNHFLGYIEEMIKCPQQLKSQFDAAYEKYGIVGKCDNYFRVKQVRYTRELGYSKYSKTNREVYIPDFALFKAPKYEYIREIGNIELNSLYLKGQKVVVIADPQYFGYTGYIEDCGMKNKASIMLQGPSYKITTRIQQNEEQFYKLANVSQKLALHSQVILAILDQLLVLPKTKKSYNTDIYPISVNFGLNVINRRLGLICPYYARCQMQYQNTENKEQIFDHVEISQRCLIALREYIDTFQYIVNFLEDSIVNSHDFSFKKGIRVWNLFENGGNYKMFREFLKLYQIQVPGYFYSVYSKVAKIDYQTHDFQPNQRKKILIQLPFSHFISKKQAAISSPSFRLEPEFHDIGDRVIIMKTLEIGYIVGIDDHNLYIKTRNKKGNKSLYDLQRCTFMEAFNEKWGHYLLKEEGKSWHVAVSYYSPTHYTNAL